MRNASSLAMLLLGFGMALGCGCGRSHLGPDAGLDASLDVDLDGGRNADGSSNADGGLCLPEPMFRGSGTMMPQARLDRFRVEQAYQRCSPRLDRCCCIEVAVTTDAEGVEVDAQSRRDLEEESPSDPCLAPLRADEVEALTGCLQEELRSVCLPSVPSEGGEFSFCTFCDV